MEDFIIPTRLIKKYKTMRKSKRSINVKEFNLGTLETDESFMPSYINNGKTLVGNFGSLAEFFALITGPFSSTEGLRYSDSLMKSRGGNWTVFDDYETALDVMLSRPQELVKFKTNEVELNDGEESGREVSFDVTGDFLDIGRYLDGVPEVFGYNHEGKHRGKRVKILVSGNAQCSTEADALVTRSKRLSRLVDWLEYQGIRVALHVAYSNDNAHSEIKIKDFQDPLNITDVAISTHGDFFRRFDFRFKEYSATIDSGYGYSREFYQWFSRYGTNLLNNLPLGEYFVYIDGNLASSGSRYVDKTFDSIENELKNSIELGTEGRQVFTFS
jgi:hypothetical protein